VAYPDPPEVTTISETRPPVTIAVPVAREAAERGRRGRKRAER
jgi:hypothetical protein